jgi:hypothetical protein
MSSSNRRSGASHRFGIAHVLAGWAVALCLALVVSADFVASILVPQHFNAEEAECRSKEDKADTARKSSAGQIDKPTGSGDDTDPYYKSREYCVARRSAIAGEQQASFAKGQVYLGVATLIAAALAAVGAVLAATRARQTVETMQDTAQRELRAYLAGVPDRIVGLVPTEQPQFWFKVTNHGTTPARHMNHAAIMMIEAHPLPDNYAFPVLQPPHERASIAVLHPESPVPYFGQFTRGNPFTGAEIIEVLHGHAAGTGRRLHVFGQIDYTDIFGKRCWTRFCVSFKGRQDLIAHAQAGDWNLVTAGLNRPGLGLFESAKQHNEIDGD